MPTPRVSVIIPTYNRARYLAEAVESVTRQSFRDWEILIADDGSTDDSRQRVASFAGRLRYLELPHSGRPAIARNAALKEARGTYVAFLDSDDLLLPGKLEAQVRALERHGEAAMAYSDGIFFRDDPSRPTGTVLDGVEPRSGPLFPALLRGNFVFISTVLVRRAFLDEVGWFDESPDLVSVEDFDLWLRLAARYPVCYVAGRFAAVRRHDASLTRDTMTMRSRIFAVFAKLAQLHPELVAKHRVAFHEAYARNHAAICLENARRRRFLAALGHGMKALGHLPFFAPGAVPAFLAWKRNHKKRMAARA